MITEKFYEPVDFGRSNRCLIVAPLALSLLFLWCQRAAGGGGDFGGVVN